MQEYFLNRMALVFMLFLQREINIENIMMTGTNFYHINLK